MKIFESNVQRMKYLINKEAAYCFFQGTMVKEPMNLRFTG